MLLIPAAVAILLFSSHKPEIGLTVAIFGLIELCAELGAVLEFFSRKGK